MAGLNFKNTSDSATRQFTFNSCSDVDSWRQKRIGESCAAGSFDAGDGSSQERSVVVACSAFHHDSVLLELADVSRPFSDCLGGGLAFRTLFLVGLLGKDAGWLFRIVPVSDDSVEHLLQVADFLLLVAHLNLNLVDSFAHGLASIAARGKNPDFGVL